MACDDTTTDLKDVIEANAKRGIASTTVGERSTTAMDPLKQIEADKYLSAKAIAGSPLRAIKRVKAIPPSSLGD